MAARQLILHLGGTRRRPGSILLALLALSLWLLPAQDAQRDKADDGFSVEVSFMAEPNPPVETHRVLQPVHQYQSINDPQAAGRQRIEQKINPFLAYTHLGTDFGFIGVGEGGLGWEVGTVCISMPPGYWGGMWHSLSGLGADAEQTLDFRACYPAPTKAARRGKANNT